MLILSSGTNSSSTTESCSQGLPLTCWLRMIIKIFTMESIMLRLTTWEWLSIPMPKKLQLKRFKNTVLHQAIHLEDSAHISISHHIQPLPSASKITGRILGYAHAHLFDGMDGRFWHSQHSHQALGPYRDGLRLTQLSSGRSHFCNQEHQEILASESLRDDEDVEINQRS